jgi:hypothetical protein
MSPLQCLAGLKRTQSAPPVFPAGYAAPSGPGRYVTQSQASAKCLDDPAFNVVPGTQLDLWTCNGGANQQWAVP